MLSSKSYLSATTVIFKINQPLETKLNPDRWAEANTVDHHIHRYKRQYKLITINVKIIFTLTFTTKKKKKKLLNLTIICCVFQTNTTGEMKDSELVIPHLTTGHNPQSHSCPINISLQSILMLSWYLLQSSKWIYFHRIPH